MIQIFIDTKEAESELQQMAAEYPRHVAIGMTRTAKIIQSAIKAQMRADLDRPTNWTLNATVVTPATKDSLRALVGMRWFGGKGTPAGKYLLPLVEGGERRDKRSEAALRAKNLLPTGYQTAIGPGAPRDAHGNMPAHLYISMLSGLRSFSEVGYTMNRKKGQSSEYFAAMPGDARMAPGIYRRTGRKASMLLAFITKPSYTANTFDFWEAAKGTANTHLLSEVRKALEEFKPSR
jgi:hypothetical protein